MPGVAERIALCTLPLTPFTSYCILQPQFPFCIMDARLRRVNKEIYGSYLLPFLSTVDIHNITESVDCKNDKASNISIDLIDNSPFHLKGSFPGPEGTPYEGGHFEVVRASPTGATF